MRSLRTNTQAVERRGTKEMHLTLYGDPRTKKNSARILQGRGGRRFVATGQLLLRLADCMEAGLHRNENEEVKV